MFQLDILKTKTCLRHAQQRLQNQQRLRTNLFFTFAHSNSVLFTEDDINPNAVKAAKDLIKCGLDEAHLKSDYKVVAHRQLIATESPGRKLYREIRMWPEWLEDASSIKN